MTSIGKIARLPHRVREELNWRLREGEKRRRLVTWLNSLPNVQAVLNDEFAGRPIREQNISQWRKGGYRVWLAQRVAVEQGREMCVEVAEMQRICNVPMTDHLASFLGAHYAVAIKKAVRDAAGGSLDLKTLRTMCGDVVALRRGEQEAQWLSLEQKRLKLDEEESVVRSRINLDRELDSLREFLDRHQYSKEAKAAWADFMQELRDRNRGKFETKGNESTCTPPQEGKGTGAESVKTD